MKSTVIFSDQSESKHEPVVSRDEYHNAIKEAYKEGVKDARSESDEAVSSPKKDSADAEKEVNKTEAHKKEETKQKVDAITARKDIELLRVKTQFPFTLFPDTIIIDTTKLTIMRKTFFSTEFITTVPLKDLADVTVQTALFLASITIKYMPQASSPGMLHPVVETITTLRREDAIKAKNILKGALVAKAEEVDIAKLSPEEIKTVIEKFGQTEGVT